MTLNTNISENLNFYTSDEIFNKYLSSLATSWINRREDIIKCYLPRVMLFDYETQRYYIKQQVQKREKTYFYFKPLTIEQFKKQFTDIFDSKTAKWCIENIQQHLCLFSCVSFSSQFKFKAFELDDSMLNGKDEIVSYSKGDISDEEFFLYTTYLQTMNSQMIKTTKNKTIKNQIFQNRFENLIEPTPEQTLRQRIRRQSIMLSEKEYEKLKPQLNQEGINNGFVYFINYIRMLSQTDDKPMGTAISINIDPTQYTQASNHLEHPIRRYIQPFLDCLYEGEILEIQNTNFIKDNFAVLGPVKLIIYCQDDNLKDEEIIKEYEYLQQLLSKEFIGFESLTDKSLQKKNNIGCIIIGPGLKQELFEKAKLLNCPLNLGNLDTTDYVLENSVQNVIKYNYYYKEEGWSQYDFRYYALETFQRLRIPNFHSKRNLPPQDIIKTLSQTFVQYVTEQQENDKKKTQDQESDKMEKDQQQ